MATCQDCGKNYQRRCAEVQCPECWKIESDSIDELFRGLENSKKEKQNNG